MCTVWSSTDNTICSFKVSFYYLYVFTGKNEKHESLQHGQQALCVHLSKTWKGFLKKTPKPTVNSSKQVDGYCENDLADVQQQLMEKIIQLVFMLNHSMVVRQNAFYRGQFHISSRTSQGKIPRYYTKQGILLCMGSLQKRQTLSCARSRELLIGVINMCWSPISAFGTCVLHTGRIIK